MRILIINTFYYPNILGGAEISVKKLAEGLAERGHEVHVICTDKQDKTENINGVNIHRIKPNNVTTPIQLGEVNKAIIALYRVIDFDNKLNKGKLIKLIKEINPDIAHINNIPGLSISIWDALKVCNIPIIHTLRDYYLLCPKINLLKNGCICKNKNIICKLYTNYKKRVFKMDTCVTAPSNFTLNVFKDQHVLENNTDTEIIYNAIDFDINKCKEIMDEKLKRDNNIIKFVYIGSLHEHKGIKWLLESFCNIKSDNIELHIAGSGPLKELLLQSMENDKRIHYHGFLKENEVNELLQDCDVSLVTSIWYEPFGRVVIDAYKNGMPVIGSDIGGISEIIDDGKTGVLVKPNSNKELIEAINMFSNRELIKEKIENCINKLENFSLDVQLDNFENLYEKYIMRGK